MNKVLSAFIKEKLNPYDKIVIYGAGLYGKLFLEKMYELQIYKKTFFAVTGEPQEKEVLGHDVFDIASFAECGDSFIVVLAVGPNLNFELIKNLKKLNILNYLELNSELRKYLKTETVDRTTVVTEAVELIQEIYCKLLHVERRMDKLEQNLVMENENSIKLDKIYRLFLEKRDE